MRLINLLISSAAFMSMATAVEVDATLIAEVEALVMDIRDYEPDYVNMIMSDPTRFNLDGLPGIADRLDDNGYYTGDKSYLSGMTNLGALQTLVHELPWYSSRLQRLVKSFLSGGDASASATAASATIGNIATVTSSFNQIRSTSISASASMNKTSSAEAGNKSKNGSTSPLAKGMAALIVGAMAMIL